jgi:two-component system sensor histidine kinase ChvG
MKKIRLDILQVFIFALGVTVLLSLYLAGTIARPINRLASAAELVRTGHGRYTEIPDFSARGDEIGDLSRDLRGMTEALWKRMDEIERFAADVAHEIKNPLTSLRSAVETVARINDPEQQKQLISIIIDDVQRLDRLISDISDASRLDAELSRDVPAPINLRSVLSTLIEVESNKDSNKKTIIDCHLEEETNLTVYASEGRLGQVFLNIISNATSFSPVGKKVTVKANRVITDENANVIVTVDDEGQGIPEENLESIFERFYTDRPIQELESEAKKYEVHSGLGLSISRQIVEAAGGQIWAENRRNDRNEIAGARIIVKFPASNQN